MIKKITIDNVEYLITPKEVKEVKEDNRQFVIYRDNEIWTDFLKSVEDALDHIKESIEKSPLSTFTLREMTPLEVKFGVKVLELNKAKG